MKPKSILCSAVIFILILGSFPYSDLSAQIQPEPKVQQLIKVDPKQIEGKSPCNCLADTKVITFYENESIPAEMGISSGVYTKVEGYRYINITVEFDQRTAAEKPVTLSVMFGFSSTAELGSGKYFNFENNYTNSADPIAIAASGKNSWMGSPHNISRYTIRIPIMAPFIQVFPYNLESRARRVTIKAYLST
ncbi:MAG: hypothetical protein JXA06_03675 [Bacteroidetes bacterium]|nr:hypothetical protein [Bacteroidota bacterium]